MAPVATSKLGAPMFELDVVRKKMHCIEESTSCDIVGTFRRRHSDSAPGDCALLPPSLRPCLLPMSSVALCNQVFTEIL